MNLADILVLAVLAVAMFFCIRAIYRNFHSGGGCMGCPDGGSCQREQSSVCHCADSPKPADIRIRKRGK